MTPEQLASQLRKIAAKLDKSRRPSVTAVLKDLQKLSHEIEVLTNGPRPIASVSIPINASLDVSNNEDYRNFMTDLNRSRPVK